ncbi:MAG: T9SS type A sorting domain-containing protein [Candidatus Cloacimonetes bacterium]|nr:T9SS type A sorting domain-containing protein [Candidatus Cloacimonadota bacterium]
MKKLLVFIIMLFIALNLPGYTCWEENGISIRQETKLNYSGTVIKLSSGDYMLMWSDAASGTQKMKVQKMSEAGENLWEEPIILSENELYYPNGESLAETSDGDIVAVWHERQNPIQIRCQKLDTDGNLHWGYNGLSFEMNFNVGYDIDTQVFADLNGGVFITFFKIRSVTTLNITSEGEIAPGWGNYGNSIFISSTFNSYSCISDVLGGIVILAHNYYDDHWYLQRCDDQGDHLWTQTGIDAGDFNMMKIINWNYGELALVSYRYTETEIKATVIDLGGNFLYTELQTVAEIPEEVSNLSYMPVKTGDNKLGIIYSGSHIIGLRAQKTDLGLAPEWDAEGIIISDQEYYFEFSYANLIPDDSGGLAVFWHDSSENVTSFLMEHINTDGSIDLDNIMVAEIGTDYNDYPVLFNNTADETAIFWKDMSDCHFKIKMQIADSYGNMLLPEDENNVWQGLGGGVNWNITELATNGEYSCICWPDSRFSTDYNTIFTQVFSNDTGELLFADQGIAVSDYHNSRQQYPVATFNETGDKFCIAYKQDYTDPEAEGARIQIMDLEGNRLLGNSGYALSGLDMEVMQEGIAVCSQDDDFIVFWNDYETSSEDHIKTLNVQKFVDCEPIWENPTLLTLSGLDQFELLSIFDNYIVWEETTFSVNGKLMIARISDDGEIDDNWGEEGIEIASGDYIQDVMNYITDDGIVVIWREYIDQKAQYVSATGDLLWGDDGYFFENESYRLADAQVIEDKLIGFFRDYNSQSYKFIEFDLNESGGWDEPVVFNSTPIISQPDNTTMDIWENMIIVYWSGINDNDVYAMIFDLEGNLIPNFPPEGISVIRERHDQYCHSSVVDNSGSSIVIWQDTRGSYLSSAGPSIYAQKIDLTSVSLTDSEIPEGNMINLSNYPNPFMVSTNLKCDLPRGIENAEILIYNIRGHKVRSIPASSNDVVWDCRNQEGKLAGSGVYFYVLQGKNFKSKTGKMILLR